MGGLAMLVDCPAFLSEDGAVRCGLPAEVQARYTAASTAGPLESAKIRCPRGHWFNGPVESLTIPQSQPNLPVRPATRDASPVGHVRGGWPAPRRRAT
jgi:hypothetical protein